MTQRVDRERSVVGGELLGQRADNGGTRIGQTPIAVPKEHLDGGIGFGRATLPLSRFIYCVMTTR